MKRLFFLMLILFSLFGCSNTTEVNFDQDATLIVEERIGDELSSDYQVINEINDPEIVQQFIDIFQDTKWYTDMEGMMGSEPNIKLNKSYHIWITPLGDRLEIINIYKGAYGRLSETESYDLYKIMTGKELKQN